MKKTATFIVCILCAIHLAAQDKKTYIYLGNGTGVAGAKLESMPEEDKISFSINQDIVRTFQKERVQIAFNDKGGFLVVNTLPLDIQEANAMIENFYNLPSLPQNDLIVKAVPFEIIPCTIAYAGTAINYRDLAGASSSINESNVLMVIRKDGSHELYGDVFETVPILGSNVNKINAALYGAAKENPQSTPAATHAATPATTRQEAMVTAAAKLTAEEKSNFSNESVDNILIFKDYLNIIGDKRKSITEKREAIKSALELFSPGSTIEVSSTSRAGVRRLPVETYLRNLSNLNYSSVKIEYANLKFVSELSQAHDGNYYGVVRGEQSFVGFGANGRPLYSDVVDKNYKVKLESYKKVESGIEEFKWKILLGDVSISQ